MAITGTYLTNPEMFPTAGDGVPGGDHVLFIDFVGGPYRVSGLNDEQIGQLRNHFTDVCTSSHENDADAVNIYVYELPPSSFHLPNPPPSQRTFDLDAQQHQTRIAGEHMCALIDLSGIPIGHLWTIRHENFFHSNTFENFFRILVTYRLMENGGMLLHSAGIVNRGEAFLFPGRSEDGKSTLSRLSIEEGRTVLSDDMNAVTWHDGEPWVEKVPFAGDLNRTWTRSASYPLRGIFAIRKSSDTFVEDISLSRTLTLLTACTPYINADSYRISQLLENHYQLTQKVPAHILHFSFSGNIWKVIEDSMTK